MGQLSVNSFCVLIVINIAIACLPSDPRERCCEDIESGFCFRRRGLFSNKPECPSSYSPIFTLFTRNGSTFGISISKDNIPPEFSNDRKTVYIVHGWRGSFHSNYRTLKDELIAKEDLNVIAVDWSRGASAITYIPAAANTQSIGALIGSLTNTLRTKPGSNPHFWCIGHSLGAHVCGYSSLTAQPWLDRITGVDPAGPNFGADKGLTKNTAANVDIIHTDPVFGSRHPRGHVDFYPNGGDGQPGCASPLSSRTDSDPDSMSEEDKIEAMVASATERGEIGCSHQRALVYMIQSVRDTSCFVAKQVCSNYNDIPGSCAPIPSWEQYGVMGYAAINNRYEGNLYFEAHFTSPHCAIDAA